jgi:hypothetical protein
MNLVKLKQLLVSATSPRMSLQQYKYIQEYQKIKGRCRFQKRFSGLLLGAFFMLQYSVPILLVVLGSIASSREQIATFLSSDDNNSTKSTEATSEAHKPNKPASDAEHLVSEIVYLVGLITILLGVINNIVRPAESYDTAAKYNNEFFRFEQKLDLEFLAVTSSVREVDSKDTIKTITNFLIKKNEELCQLIEEYNEARSLSPHQTYPKVMSQDIDKIAKNSSSKELQKVDYDSSGDSSLKTGEENNSCLQKNP